MALPQEIEPLSRAVSQIDLNQALNVLKDSSNTPRVLLDREKSKSELPKYSADEIIQIRTGTENNPIDHVEHAYISKPDFLGAVPPPYLSYPKVPPPTPATNATVPKTTVSELSIVEEDVEEKVEEKDEEVKKKKKKSSSKKKKTPATGFEGLLLFQILLITTDAALRILRRSSYDPSRTRGREVALWRVSTILHLVSLLC